MFGLLKDIDFPEVAKAAFIFCVYCFKKTASLWELCIFKTRLTTVRLLTFMVREGKMKEDYWNMGQTRDFYYQ